MGRFINADEVINGNGDMLGYNLYAYCSNNPVNRVDLNGQFWITTLIVTVIAIGLPLILSSCETNSPPTVVDETNYSWADNDPILSVGRNKEYDGAVEQAIDDMYEYAQNHDKEVGCLIYELYGGYYVSLPQSGIWATNHSVTIDYSKIPSGATLISTFHTHPFHNSSLIYDTMEYNFVINNNLPSYVVDVCGCVYLLPTSARDQTDYIKLR